MKTICVLAFLLAGMTVLPANAVESNTWTFSASSEYVVSDSNKIEVADGVARLILQNTHFGQNAIADYRTNSADDASLAMGPDMSLGVIPRQTNTIAGPFISRVFDGGVGNTWQLSKCRASNADQGIILAETPASMSGLIALYHLNNNTTDAVSGQTGTFYTVYGTLPTFTNDCKVGSTALKNAGTCGLILASTNSLNGATEFTMGCWVKMLGYRSLALLIGYRSADGSKAILIRQTANLSGGISFLVGSSAFEEISCENILPSNQWCFVVGTAAVGQPSRLYVNGMQVAQSVNSYSGSIVQDQPFRVGIDSYAPTARYTTGIFDEVLIFRRALNSSEVMSLYTRFASVGLQLRSGNVPELAGNFTGPSGTQNDYFDPSLNNLTSIGGFNVSDRYVQYRLFMGAKLNQSPSVGSVTLMGSQKVVFDDVMGDFGQGIFQNFVTNSPASLNYGRVQLSPRSVGGFPQQGTFTSRTFDPGFPVVWSKITWVAGSELTSTLLGLEGLWHFNESPLDSSGKGRPGSAINNVSYTRLSKVGSYSLVLDGVSAYIDIPSINADVQAVEFWCKPDCASGGLIDFRTNNVAIVLSNNLVKVSGTDPKFTLVYVNGLISPSLLPGWNHVAVVFLSSVRIPAASVGVVGGAFYSGMLDEMAIYSRTLLESEIAEHVATGRREVAGQISMQCRSGNALPLTGDFVGPDGTAASSFLDPSGGFLPAGFSNMRYFQYQATLSGDGDATPALTSVSMNTGTGAPQADMAMLDFEQGSFEGTSTRWVGDEMKLPNVRMRGPWNLNALMSPLTLACWHFDNADWIAGSIFIEDSSGNGRHGTANGAASCLPLAQVGLAGALFGAGGYISAPGGDLGTNDFTVSLWMKSAARQPCILITTSNSVAYPYYSLELNSSGMGVQTGAVSFVISHPSSGRKVVMASVNGLNDNNWHHVSGVRKGSQIQIYVDGVVAGVQNIGPSFGSFGSYAVKMGQYGAQGGSLDEVVVHGRALSGAEIADLATAGYDSSGGKYYTGPVTDAGSSTYWQNLEWNADAPYGQPQGSGSEGLVGLWHCDAITNGWTPDGSGNGNDGEARNGVLLNTSGRFNFCLALTGSGQPYVNITTLPKLETDAVSVEMWANFTDASNKVFYDKQSGGVGIQLGTDASGYPYFKVNGIACVGGQIVEVGRWNHLAGTYDQATARLYVNGSLVARVSVSGSAAAAVDARIGLDQVGGGTGVGLIDEVALYSRALGAKEVLDHYLAGAVTLGFQVRSWDPDPQGAFVGPDGTTNTLFTDSSGSSLLATTGINRYFQYRAKLATEDARYTPILRGVNVDAAGFPTDNPWVAPADGYGQGFLGNLLSFSHVMSTNTDDQVQYQISGNNGTNWYAWEGGEWTDVTTFTNPVSSWAMSNTKDVISANIGSFYDQIYPKVGGIFKFKAFLKSDAIRQTALDSVTLKYSSGRVVVTSPNGQEIGNNAWLIGVHYPIQWVSANSVSTRMKLEYSLDSAVTWVTIATNAPNVTGTNNYSFWTTPGTVSTNCRVRVTDMSDPTISDLSDSDFSLVERFRVEVPNGGEKWYTGRSNTIIWASALNLGLLTIDYAADGSNYLNNVVFGMTNITGSASNQYVWATPLGNSALLSESGKIRIMTLGNQGADESDNTFTLAGIEITNPQVGSAVKRGGPLNIRWVSAGAGASVGRDFSTDSGASWTNVVATAANALGSNVYTWVASAPPTDTARLRVRSLSDTNVVGLSAVFTLADINVDAPTSGTNWLMSTTNTVRWTSGGAGNNVNLYWSIDGGATWTPIVANYTNVSGSANSYNWVATRFPSATAQIKVESVKDPVNLWAASPNFNLSGVQVTSPNGAETWVKAVQNSIQWAYQSVGSKCSVQFSYDGGLTYTNVGGPGLGFSDKAYLYTATKPTVRAKAKVVADDPSPFTNVFDESDAYFTVAGITVTAPTNGAAFTIGTANSIAWTSAGSEDPLSQARLYYTAIGETNLIATVGNNQAYPGGNTYLWNIMPGATPSTTARIIVKSGAYTGTSDPFILRGIKFSTPTLGTVFDIGANAPVAWVYAGLDASAVGYFYLSTDGGVTFDPTPLNASLNWSVQAGAYPWVVSLGTAPTTNAVLKFQVTASSQPADIGFVALSQPFTIRGFKMVTPNASTVWLPGQTNSIVWLAAQAGTYASLYYAADGVTYDIARPIAINLTPGNGTNRFAWPIEYYRLPSTNARVEVVSSVASAQSDPFQMNGVRVTSPMASDVWAKDETNRIVWTAIGTLGVYDLSLVKADGSVVPITTGWTDQYYDWVVPAEAVSTSAYIRVQDSGGLTGRSDTFKIVGQPSVGIIAPAPSEYWKVSQTYNIQWSKGGKMANDFQVLYSTEPYIVTNEILGTVSLDTTNNMFSIPWTVPDRLGQTIIIVQHNALPTVRDVSQPFYVVGMFTLLSPNGGETNIYALKPTTLSWFTRGTVPAVNLYYSSDPLHATWVTISTNVPNNGGGLSDQLTTYDWTTANLESSTVKIRVEQADRPGAYDDSDADFAIRYYQILWHVYASATSSNLDSLSVSDSSGWSAAGLTSPVVHRYPYGTFNTVWSRENFFDNTVFNWAAEPSRTINVPMQESLVEPEYSVMANFTYDASNAQFMVTSWLQRKGKVMPNATKSTVSVYDATGTLKAQVSATSTDANGVFWQALSTAGLVKGTVYFAKVEIVYSGITYSSGLTFNLTIPTDAEQAQLIQDIVSRIDTNLTDLAAAQAIFRQSATAKLDSLTNSAAVITAGVTNLNVKIDLLSTQALAQLSALTNAVGVIGVGDTNNLVEMVQSLATGGIVTRSASILTRPTSVKFGSTMNVLYRSKEGLTVTCKVLNADGTPTSIPQANMTGAGGIYEAALSLTALNGWGIGDYQIVCSDSSSSSDRMIIKVTATDIDDLGLTLGSVSGSLARVELTLTNMATTVSNVNVMVAGTTNNINSVLVNVSNMTAVVGTLAQLTNMNVQVAVMTNAIDRIAGMTNFAAQMNALTNVVYQLTPLTNMAPMLTQLAPLTNFAPQLNYVTNIVSQLINLTNFGAQMTLVTGAVGQVSSLTNLLPQTAYLTDMMGKLAGLTNMPGQVAGLTNMPSQIDGIAAAVGQLGSLTNLGTQVSALSGSLDKILAITNMASQLDKVSFAVDALGSLTNLGPQVDALSGALDKIISLTNMESQMTGIAGAIGQLSSLTNLGSQVDSLTSSLGKIMALTNTAAQVNALTTSMNSLTNLGSKVDQLSGTMATIATFTNMVGTLNSVQTAIGQLGSLTNLGSQVDALSGSLDKIIALTNMAGQVNYLTVAMNSMTNVSGKVDQLAGTLNAVATFTNMEGTLNYVAGAVGHLGSLTNLGPQVDALSGSLDKILAITNMASQLNGVAATVNKLSSLTNLGSQVSALNGAIGEIMALTNMAGQVNGVAAGVGGLQTAVATISNTLASLNAEFLAFQTASNGLSQIGTLAPAMAAFSSTVSNLQTTITPMQASLAGVSALSSNISEAIGSQADGAGTATLFGYLSGVEKNLNSVGVSAQQAMSRAGGARSQANAAAGAAQRIKQEVASGQMPKVLDDLMQIKKALEATMTQVKEIPGGMTTEELVKTVTSAASTIKRVADERGISTPLGQGGAVQAGSLSDPKAVGDLLNKLSETKAMMEATRLLMDEAVNKPVVVDWLEGTK